MNTFKTYLTDHAEELGIFQYGFLPTDKISFSEEVRSLCEMNSCGHYNRSWVCPPGVGTYEACRDRILSFKEAFVFTSKHDLEDSFDFEGMMAGKDKHNEICEAVLNTFRQHYTGNCLVLAGEGCSRCAACTYPDAPCRFPEKAFPSIESYGAQVNKLAATLGINYINGANTVTYFGCICFD